MKHGPPGMTEERWQLHLKEVAAETDKSVMFTPAEVAILHADALEIDKHPGLAKAMR